ncbi:MAG: bifunctional phosphopantothenoylcysteine decarboxylase/phosphopantothenate--cysteine ligase CoaBC [Candidatus Eremiobacteraeota bacterium]|nr:bifunctional phosphopantothenoylcysteine decarboxylase/phosphopantothenate--cysteine ligase CoaBC [Candidatus Eremiobacteraeota bacterium]
MRIVLGVAGGIAAYKAAALCSTLVQRGDEVDVVMTDGAERFVGALTFAALTRRPVLTSLWDAPDTIPHIALARSAGVIAIVPATANVVAKLALGIADDLLTNVALAARVPLVVAPAMNSAMYEHPATRGHLETLRARGVTIVEPGVGFLAERETGIGRLADADAIVAAIDAAGARANDLAGERVVVTAGPTREAIDPARYLSNASTGTMGIELAREAVARGADVDLVLGPTTVEPPAGARVTRVVSADDMYAATMTRAAHATFALAAAAVADWRPAEPSADKRKKHDGDESLALVRTPDILAALGARKNGTFLVGFAAETRDVERYAREKLSAKNLDAIAANDVSRDDAGFGTGANEIVLLWPDGGREDLGRASKAVLARRMWDSLLRIRAERAKA